jgi:hypothetical protein
MIKLRGRRFGSGHRQVIRFLEQGKDQQEGVDLPAHACQIKFFLPQHLVYVFHGQRDAYSAPKITARFPLFLTFVKP